MFKRIQINFCEAAFLRAQILPELSFTNFIQAIESVKSYELLEYVCITYYVLTANAQIHISYGNIHLTFDAMMQISVTDASFKIS